MALARLIENGNREDQEEEEEEEEKWL